MFLGLYSILITNILKFFESNGCFYIENGLYVSD